MIANPRPTPNGIQDPDITQKLLEADAHHRRLSVGHHDQLRREMLGALLDEHDYDEIDYEAAADPIHDHRPQSAPGHKVNRVLGILDQLDRNTNRRFIS